MLAITNLLASQPIASGVGCNEPIGKNPIKYQNITVMKKVFVIYIIELKIEQERKL